MSVSALLVLGDKAHGLINDQLTEQWFASYIGKFFRSGHWVHVRTVVVLYSGFCGKGGEHEGSMKGSLKCLPLLHFWYICESLLELKCLICVGESSDALCPK